MPDISMCTNTKCPKRMDCYRYRAVPKERAQTMFCPTKVPCDHFWPIEDGMRLAGVPMADSWKKDG